MRDDQKRRAIQMINAIKTRGSTVSLDAVASHMAALLQELVDAPEPEPFGYFKSEPFGWTDCAETDDGAIALYTAPPAPSVPDEQLQAAFDRGLKAGNEQAIAQQIEIHKLHDLLAVQQPAQPAELARDAARYRWLLNQAWFQQAADRFDFTDGGMQNRFEKCMDEFIDAAIATEKGGE